MTDDGTRMTVWRRRFARSIRNLDEVYLDAIAVEWR
jgi:hypothetical protein